MQRGTHKCLAGCGRAITWRFAICSECEKQYGRSPNEWPEWLAFLWRDEQRMRRQHKRVQNYELSFSDLPDDLMLDDRQDSEEDSNE